MQNQADLVYISGYFSLTHEKFLECSNNLYKRWSWCNCDSPFLLNQQRSFLKLCKDTGLLDKDSFTAVDADLIFAKASEWGSLVDWLIGRWRRFCNQRPHVFNKKMTCTWHDLHLFRWEWLRWDWFLCGVVSTTFMNLSLTFDSMTFHHERLWRRANGGLASHNSMRFDAFSPGVWWWNLWLVLPLEEGNLMWLTLCLFLNQSWRNFQFEHLTYPICVFVVHSWQRPLDLFRVPLFFDATCVVQGP